MALSAAAGILQCFAPLFGKPPGLLHPSNHHKTYQGSLFATRNCYRCKPIELAHRRNHNDRILRSGFFFSASKDSVSHPFLSPRRISLAHGHQVRSKKLVISGSASAGKSLKGPGCDHQEQLLLTVSDVRLRLAPVEELIPVERRLPAPKDMGVYALVPAAVGQQATRETNPFGLQRMTQADAMGLAFGAATGKRTGPVDGPGWTLLDPATSLGANSLPAAGPFLSKSPRRTLRVEFTCNKCWERTVRAINPQAYKTGTVFVQCKGCNVYHKLVDNLNLFHELKGPIYTPPGQLFHTPYDPFETKNRQGGFDGLPFV